MIIDQKSIGESQKIYQEILQDLEVAKKACEEARITAIRKHSRKGNLGNTPVALNSSYHRE